MVYIFDGKAFAAEKKKKLVKKVESLKKNGVTPRLITVLVGDDPASVLYVNLKNKAGESIGCRVDLVTLKNGSTSTELIKLIKKYNNDDQVHGIMVQLPIPGKTREETREIINSISPIKDVDGMRDDSPFLAPVVKAVIVILNYAFSKDIVRHTLKARPLKEDIVNMVIVGSKGFVGGKLIKLNFQKLFGDSIPNLRFNVRGQDVSTKDLKLNIEGADILVSATGTAELITKDMIKPGAVVVDVGSPIGDVAKDAYTKAGFVSPVPGGVGPVTIGCLLENLVTTASNLDD